MLTTTAQRIAPASRSFAEFIANQSWHDLGTHIRRLHGAEYLGFHSLNGDACLQFSYRGHEFCIQESGRLLVFKVEDSTCPDRVLFEVQSHFAALLAPDKCD
jgi:hypothetical protein